MTNIINVLPDKLQKEVKRAMKDNQIVTLTDFASLDKDFIMKLQFHEEQTIETGEKKQKVTVSSTIPTIVMQKIFSLQSFSHYLLNDASISDHDEITSILFETFLLEKTNPTLKVDVGKELANIQKFDKKDVLPYNGHKGKWPNFRRTLSATATSLGLVEFVTYSTTPPEKNQGSNTWKLWDARNKFLVAAYTLRVTGGQAAIIVRKNADKDNGALLIFQAWIDHYESADNKSAIITLLTGNLLKMQYDNRTHQSMDTFLTNFQTAIEDLAEITGRTYSS